MLKISSSFLFVLLLQQISAQQLAVPTQKETVFPIIPINLKSSVTPPTPAQAEDRLLWYKGKKVNDSILVTTDASLILYSKKRDIVVVQTNSKKDPWLKTIKKMEAIEQDKQKLVDAAAGKPNSFFLYPHITATIKNYDQQNEDYAKALQNVVPLPEAIPTTALRSYSSGYASKRFVFIGGVPAAVKQAFEETIQKKKNYPSLDFPPPPQENFGACYKYDGIAQNQHYIDRYRWQNEFTKYEKDLVHRALSIFKTIETLKLNADPEAIQIHAGLEDVIAFAFARMKNKIDLLLRNYGKDFTRLPAVIQMTISIERQKQLLGAGEDSSAETIGKIISLLDGFEEYIEQQMAARNYDVVFNVAFMIGIERQRQLLGATDEKSPPDFFYKIFLPFNRFKIEMDVDFAMVADEDYKYVAAAATLSTRKDHHVTLIPYKNGGFTMLLTNTIYKPDEEDIGQELDYHSAESGKYDLELKATNGYLKAGDYNGSTYSFEGAEMLSHLPVGRIYFCKGKEDTLYLQGFYPKGGGTSSLAYWMHYELNHMFHSSHESLEEDASNSLGEQEEFQRRRKAYEVEPSGFEKLDKMQNQYNIVEQYQKNVENVATKLLSKDAMILFDAENGEPEIMNASNDVSGKIVDVIKINKGIIRVKIVHDPLPYKRAASAK